MKNLFKFGILSLFLIVLATSCEEDLTTTPTPGPGTTTDNPEIALLDEAGFISAATTVAPGATFTIKLQAAKGANDLSGILFDLDGSPFGAEEALAKITIDGAPAPSDAAGVRDTELASLTWVVDIIAHDDEASRVYTFTARDIAGLDSSVDLVITTDSNATGGGGVGTVVEPTINITGSDFSGIDAGSLVNIPIDITAGNPQLFRMGVLQVIGADSTWVDPSRLELGGDDFTDNPMELLGNDVNGFTKNLFVRAQTTAGTVNYIIIFSDTDGNIYSREFTISTAPLGNVVTEKVGMLLNKAGPVNTGGLDFETGNSTGSSDVEAEIKDNGIDNGPLTQNWLQTISGVNGTEIKYLIPNMNGLSENFSYADISTDEEIRNAWGSAVDFTSVNPDGQSSSNAVNIGDIFVANKGGQYYIFNITNITVTPDNNDDFYTMDIKF